VVVADSAAGAVATYNVTATDPDNTKAQLTITCLPDSGSTFPLGPRGNTKTTTVTCQAHDPAGNSARPESFTVTVLGAHAQIAALERDVSASKRLTKNQRRSLVSMLAQANRSLTSRATVAAKSQLHSFVAQLRKLPSAVGNEPTTWIKAATRIVGVIK
jgi:hypothetical protein